MRALALGIAAALLMAGCGSADPKEPKPTTAPTAPTATVPEPTVPAQANDATPEGVASFVKYYVTVFNYAAATGDTATLRSISSKCAACTKYADKFDDVYAKGEQIPSPLWRASSQTLEPDGDFIDVMMKIQTLEHNEPVHYKLGFVVPQKPPYKVHEIFQGDSK